MLRRYRSGLILTFAVLGMASCDMPATATKPPYTVEVNAKGRAAKPDGKYTAVKVNAFENVAKHGARLEDLLDVPCTVSSQYFTKDILAPAVVNVPTFGDNSPDLKVRCTYRGQSVERRGGVFKMGNGNIEYANQSLIFD